MATIGYATLQVIPSLSGVSGAMQKQLGGLAGMGKAAGRQLGDGLADGVDQASKRVEAASKRVVAARNKTADAAGKVRTAEAQLTALRERGVADAGRLTAAEERVAKAKRDHETVSKTLAGTVKAETSAQDQLAAAQKRVGDASDEAANKGGRFSGWLSRLRGDSTDATSGIGAVTSKLGGLFRMAGGASLLALPGVALAKGFTRLQDIDAAESKLSGLGHSAESVAAIMDSATKAVTGTSFGLGEAANVAASAVAAGVKPGEELQRTLTLVADAAAIAGTDLNSMGAIFNKVATGDLIQGEELAQLGDRGIPILQLLADQMGVTAAEAKKMASDGKIDFATFQNAIETGMSGAAQEMGGTFSGAVANVGAALGRLGADVLKPVFDAIITASPVVIAGIDQIGAAIGPAFEGVGAVVGGVVDAFKSVVDFVSRNSGVFGTLAAAIGGVALAVTASMIPAFARWLAQVVLVNAATAAYLVQQTVLTTATKVAAAAQWLWNAALTANPIGIVVAAIAGLVAGLVYFFTQTETGRRIWETVWGAIKTATEAVVSWFTDTVWPALQAVWEGITAGWNGLVDTAQAVWDGVKQRFTAMVDWFKSLPAAIANAANGMWEGVKSGLVSVLNWIGDKWNSFADALSFNIPNPFGDDINVSIPKLPRFSGGGFTGNLAADKIAGVVHGGEFVINARSTGQLENKYPGLLDLLNRVGALPGYAAGGLVAGTAELRKIISERFGISDIGGYRPADGYNEHSTGRALDVMTSSKAKGDAVKDFAVANASAIDLKWAIWQQRLWLPDGSSRPMEDRGSPTQNHMDHVHIFSGPAIAKGLLGALKSKDDKPATDDGIGDDGLGPADTSPGAARSAEPPDKGSVPSGSGGASVPSSLSELSSWGLDGLGAGVGKTGAGSDLSLFGKAAGSAISGQVSSALGVFGVNDSPGWLKGISQFVGGLSISDANGNKIFDGGDMGSLFGGGQDAVTPIAAQPVAHGSAGGAAPGHDAGGTRPQPGPQTNYFIRTATVEDAFLQAQRRERERAAAKLARY